VDLTGSNGTSLGMKDVWSLTAKIDNLYQGDIQLPVVSKTLTVGPMDIDGVPHR